MYVFARYRYYRALSSIETRFPISKDAGHVHVSFIWFDAFRPSKRAEQVTMALQHNTQVNTSQTFADCTAWTQHAARTGWC